MKNLAEKYNLSAKRILLHILFWSAFVVSSSLYHGWPYSIQEELLWTLRYLPFKMLVTYFTLYFIIPGYLYRKRYFSALFIFVLAVLVGAVIQQSVEYAILAPLLNPNWTETHYLFYPSKIFRTFLGMYPVVTIAACIKLAKNWYEKDRQAQELKQQKLEAELNFLKSQIHPHFLFNTLNNLYALTLKKSDESPEVVMKLSELLSFILYECNSETISIEKEIKILENYIGLEKIRYDQRLDLNFQKEIDSPSREIPPMLLLPFVENAFKHGVSNEIDDVSVSITLKVQNSDLKFTVENSKVSEQRPEDDYQKGIGLQNARRRLDLLFGEYYTLDIEDRGTTYRVSLRLELDKLKRNQS